MQDKPHLTSKQSYLLKEPLYLQRIPHNHASPPNYTSRRHGQPSASSSCFLMSLPDESLTHITSFVADPSSLFALSRVNRRLRDHIADENTWFRAFALHFLGVGPEAEPQGDKILMLRRAESTWMKEYITRVNLIRRWEKSRSTTLSYQPHYWDVSSMHLLENVSLMTANLQYGIVARSFPLTGKTLKGYLDASGTRNGLGIGNPNEEFSPNVTSVTLSSSGGTGRIAWSFRNGEVAVTFAPRIMESHGSAARYVRCRIEDEHPREVQCIAFAGQDDELLITGCAGGVVKVWETKRMRCPWSSNAKSTEAGLPAGCTAVELNPVADVLVASFTDGDIMMWWGLHFLSGEGNVSPTQTLCIPREESSESPTIKHLLLDPKSSSSCANVLIHYADSPHFFRYTVHITDGVVLRTQFGNDSIGAITMIKACFATAGECSFVLSGDSLGRMYVWDWNIGRDGAESQAKVDASRKWEAHEDGAVCAIEVDGAIIATGSESGIIKLWDSLTLTPLRTFSSPSKIPTQGGSPVPVGQIIVRGGLLLASFGCRILVWQAAAVTERKKGGARKSPGRPKGRPSGMLNKWELQIELDRDIRESQRVLAVEREHAQRMYRQERAQLETLDRLGLDENGAVEYLLMLSREEEAVRRETSGTSPADEAMSTEDPGSRSTDEAIEGVFSLDDHPTAVNTPHPPPSTRRFTPPTSNSKVQVSPPFPPQLMMEAGGLSPSPLRLGGRPNSAPVPIIDERRGQSLPNLTDEFPAITGSTPPPPSTSNNGSSSSLQLSGSWLRGSPAATPTPDSSFGVVSTTKTAASAVGSASPPSSSLHSSPPRATAGIVTTTTTTTKAKEEEEEEDELTFVLKLSLAEAKSREA